MVTVLPEERSCWFQTAKTSKVAIRGQMQFPTSKCRNEKAVCEVCNPKLHISTPWSIHASNPHPKNCHADPFLVFMSQLCLWAMARSHFNYHTPLSLRRESTLCLRVYAKALFVFTRMPACVAVIVVLCTPHAYICHFRKRQQRAKCGWKSQKKGVCLKERKGKRKCLCVFVCTCMCVKEQKERQRN